MNLKLLETFRRKPIQANPPIEPSKPSVGALDWFFEAMQVLVPGGGSVVCFAVGKWVVGLMLIVVAAVVLFRLLWRRKQAAQAKQLTKLPVWAKVASALGAVMGSAVLVEMTKLPVRFDQPGFAFTNWLIVLVAIFLLNSGLRSVIRSLRREKGADPSVKP